MGQPLFSVVIPTLNEEGCIVGTLRRARLALPTAQILVVDGGSTDRTVEWAAPLAVVLHSAPGRGRQLNLGAAHAAGEILLFLHADTLLPAGNIQRSLEERMADPRVIGGNFHVRFAPASVGVRFLQLVYALMRRMGIFYGDSAIFVRREPFLQRGGFRQQSLMEDVELVRWMRRAGKIVQAPLTVTTSSRRFHGRVPYHLALWVLLTALYGIGVPDSFLVRLYPAKR